MKLSTLAVILSVLGVPSLGTATYYTYEKVQEIAANTKYRLLQEWKTLEAIRKYRPLTYSEYLTWCEVGQRLRIFKGSCPRIETKR